MKREAFSSYFRTNAQRNENVPQSTKLFFAKILDSRGKAIRYNTYKYLYLNTLTILAAKNNTSSSAALAKNTENDICIIVRESLCLKMASFHSSGNEQSRIIIYLLKFTDTLFLNAFQNNFIIMIYTKCLSFASQTSSNFVKVWLVQSRIIISQNSLTLHFLTCFFPYNFVIII